MGKLSVMAAAAFAAAASSLPITSLAQDQPHPELSCPIDHDQLADTLRKNVKPGGGPSNGGFDNNEWAAVVNRQGIVCAVAYSGGKVDDQWLGSRAIAAEKANTANAFSLKDKAMATANLYAGAQPGGFLFGAALSNPPSPEVLYAGPPEEFGTARDPMVGKPVGGVIVFGGGLALYDGNGITGALGVSGDSSCADHNVAWRVRHQLGLDRVPAGVSPNMKDAIIYDIGPDGKSLSGFGHPKCNGREDQIAVDLGAGVSGNVVR
ncbi:heme-binding protein [Bradyrhizobium sp. 61]|jgi:uncharacterized protein GlcG (DUF336 family)|uniref:heme-binding protein n=1 Tax=unclassified Bradyrhizobium TaxID=2631580 RepID=UPI001FF86340|nr:MULTISPECIES: heme-binding protein [unclassified Bradyrhizobium]MCK1274766.1 heme-binding protein [Bradyrhizobium sp. 61]MCK1441760.1 heme-binding protein [Bradyrhizobium sp. 48]MCK1465294.1 heme-binding protein [Bradyrhizobium sp. 2]